MNKSLLTFFKSTSVRVTNINGVERSKVCEIEKYEERMSKDGMDIVKKWSNVRNDWTPETKKNIVYEKRDSEDDPYNGEPPYNAS